MSQIVAGVMIAAMVVLPIALEWLVSRLFAGVAAPIRVRSGTSFSLTSQSNQGGTISPPNRSNASPGEAAAVAPTPAAAGMPSASSLPSAQRFDLQLQAAADLVKRARTCWELWHCELTGDAPGIEIDIKDRFSWFFCFDQHAHLVTAVVTLAALFDSLDDTISLGALLRAGQSSDLIPQASCAATQHLLTRLDPLVVELVDLRNRLFGPRGGPLAFAQSTRTTDVVSNLLFELSAGALMIANLLCTARGLPQHDFPRAPRKNLEDIIAILKNTPPDRYPD